MRLLFLAFILAFIFFMYTFQAARTEYRPGSINMYTFQAARTSYQKYIMDSVLYTL